jgi:arylformamidase
MLIPLSYPLTRDSPLYPGTPHPLLEEVRSLARGDRNTITTLQVHAHAGTHLDLPPHFCREEAPARLSREIIVEPAYCAPVPKEAGEWIRARDLAGMAHTLQDARAILLCTGWYRVRTRGQQEYADDYPRVHPDLPPYLREQCPSLRLFGIDTLSVAISSHRGEGAAAHRGFLCGASPIYLLEDADLSDPRLKSGSWRLRIYPWFLDARDGIPVVALAEPYP